MDKKFAAFAQALHPLFEKLISSEAVTRGVLPHNIPERDVYLFTEAGRHLYVGRSNTIRKRYGRHCTRGRRIVRPRLPFC